MKRTISGFPRAVQIKLSSSLISFLVIVQSGLSVCAQSVNEANGRFFIIYKRMSVRKKEKKRCTYTKYWFPSKRFECRAYYVRHIHKCRHPRGSLPWKCAELVLRFLHCHCEAIDTEAVDKPCRSMWFLVDWFLRQHQLSYWTQLCSQVDLKFCTKKNVKVPFKTHKNDDGKKCKKTNWIRLRIFLSN